MLEVGREKEGWYSLTVMGTERRRKMLRIRGNAWAAAGGRAQMTMEAITVVGRRWGGMSIDRAAQTELSEAQQ